MNAPADCMTLGGLLDRAAHLWGSRTAVVDGERRCSYQDLQARSDRAARGLTAMGIAKGDRVAIWLPNRLEWAVAFFAAVKAGAVVVPINTALSVTEAEYQVAQSGSAAIVVPGSFRGRNYINDVREIGRRLDRPLTVIAVGGDDVAGTVPWDKVADGSAGDGNAGTPVECSVEDPVMMLYTSGTTGSPKGAVHCHRFTSSLFRVAERLELTEDDCVILYLPLFHVYALVAGLVLMTTAGAKIVLMERFRAAQSLQLIESERATLVYGIPTTYIDQLNEPDIDKADLSSVRLAFTPFPYDLCVRVHEKFGAPCLNSFGMTETASVVFISSPRDPIEMAMRTAGRLVPGIEARILDEVTGTPVGAGTPGVLVVRGPSVMLGYHDKPAETAAALDEQGWFRTGDIAAIDEAGSLTYLGRRGDRYRVGGENVDPVEVETVLQAHPAVQRAAAVGVGDDRLGHVGYAWVQLRAGQVASAEELQQHAAQHLASFKVPRRVLFVDELPTTPSGKVQKFRLRESLVAAEASP